MGLLSSLFGNKPQVQQAPPHHFGYDADGYLTPQMNGGGAPVQSQAPAGSLVKQIAQQSPAAPSNQAPATDPNSPITVTGQDPDTWRPHHAGLLGQIADYILDTHIGRGVERKNMEEALQHLTSNPMEAVKRMAKFNPEAAQALYDKVTDNQRQSDNLSRQNDVLGLQKDRYLDGIVGNMMYAASQKNDPALYAAARQQAITYGNRYGKDYNYIPEQMDPANTEAFGMGVVPAARQMAVGEQVRNHDVQHSDRAASLSERAKFHQGELNLGGGRLGVAQENAATSGRNADTREESVGNTQERFNSTHQGKTVQSPGRPGHGTVSNDGLSMTWFMPDGTKHLYLRGKDGNHWVYSHQAKKPK
jgi:hypothetical protein